jgi:hypothetical protein
MFVSSTSDAYYFYIGAALISHRSPIDGPTTTRMATENNRQLKLSTDPKPTETKHGSIGYDGQTGTMEEHSAVARTIRFGIARKDPVEGPDTSTSESFDM